MPASAQEQGALAPARRAFVLLSQTCIARPGQRASQAACQSGDRACEENGRRAHGPVCVFGGMVLDLQAEPTTSADVQRGGSVPGRVTQAAGGVGRNICEAIARLVPSGSAAPLLVSVVGDDAAGRTVTGHLRSLGLSLRGVVVRRDAATPTVCTVFDRSGEVAAQIADATTVERCLTPDVVGQYASDITAAPVVVMDTNLGLDAMHAVCAAAARARVPVWLEPVSPPKSVRAAKVMHLLDFVSPNARELVEMSNALRLQSNLPVLPAPDDVPEEGGSGAWRAALRVLLPHIEVLLEGGVKYVVLTLGALGAALCCRHPTTRAATCFHMAALPARVVNCSGAGDCLVGGAVAALASGADPLEALAHGIAAAWHAVQSPHNVPEESLTPEAVRALAPRVLESLETL